MPRKRSDKRPAAFVDVQSPGTIHEKDTGEVVMDAGRTKLVRAFTNSVERCVSVGAPTKRFRLVANKDGRIVSAFGPIVVMSADLAFPGCTNAEQITEADMALDRADATRGNSPSGRALDWAIRKNPQLRQWRTTTQMMEVFASSLYGGIQFGGERKPRPKPGLLNIDVCSSYPYMATAPLPRIRDAVIERGLRPHATLVRIAGNQYEQALFTRLPNGNTHYAEDIFGWYSADEVDYHISMGRLRVQTVMQSCTFPHSEKYLLPAVNHFFDAREKYARGTPQRNVIKSALNGLLGKFASPISTWRTPTPIELQYAKLSRKTSTIELGLSSLIDDRSLANIYPRHSNVVWTAVTYARARIRLWQKMDEIRAAGGKVLWCHTDCIIAEVPQSYRMVSGTALGDWRIVEQSPYPLTTEQGKQCPMQGKTPAW